MDDQEALRRMRERDRELAMKRAELEQLQLERDRACLEHLRTPLAREFSPEEMARTERATALWERGAADRERNEREWREANERERLEAERKHEETQRPLREKLATLAARQAFSICPPAVAMAVAADGFQHDTKTVRGARSWARGTGRGLVLRGGVGVGKTLAAACALAEFLQSSGARADQLTWHRPNDFVSGVLHKYDQKAPPIGSAMIVIDDLGRETKSDFEEALVQLIDDTLTRFVLTTNLTIPELEERYDERLMDRLKQTCLYVSVAGSSLRKKVA